MYRTQNCSKFLLTKLHPKTDPRGICDFENDFVLHKVTRVTALLWKSPYQQTADVSYIRESPSHRQTADVICARWWPDRATFINRSARNRQQRERNHKSSKRGLQKCGSASTQRTQTAAHVTPKGTTRTACLVWEHRYALTSLLLSDKLKGHSHIFVGHVVVVVKDWWDVLLILRQLQTITTSWCQINMARKSVNSCLLSSAELVKNAVFKQL